MSDLIPVPTLDDFKRASRRAFKAWEAGEPVHRQMAVIRLMSAIVACEGDLPETTWFADCLDPEHPAYEGFSRIWGNRALDLRGTDSWLNAALHYSALRQLGVAQSPTWFSLSEALALRLLTTEIRGVYAQDVKTPFEGFLIELPPRLLWWDHAETGRHEVRSISVVEGHCKPAMTRYSDVAQHPGRRLFVMCYCEPNQHSVDPADDNLAYLSVPLFDGSMTVEEMFALDRASVEARGDHRVLAHDSDINGRFGGIELTNRQLRELVRQFVVNVLLYLSSPNADVIHVNEERARKIRKQKAKSKKAREQRKRRVQAVLAERSWLVGSRVLIDHNLKRAVSEGRGQGGKLRFKSLVRGHWRNQAYGPKWSLRKVLWIEPHVRGGELEGPLLGHQYDVQGKKTR